MTPLEPTLSKIPEKIQLPLCGNPAPRLRYATQAAQPKPAKTSVFYFWARAKFSFKELIFAGLWLRRFSGVAEPPGGIAAKRQLDFFRNF